MKLENTLIIIFTLLFSMNLFAYNVNNDCEKKLNTGMPAEAIEAAEKITNEYDKNFCQAKAYYRLNKPLDAANSFEASEKFAEQPIDQMFSMLYKGISQRDAGLLDVSVQSFIKGLETAKLGNSKYMQMEQRFLNQLGNSYLILKDGDKSLESYSSALAISSNDDERASNFKGVSQAYALTNDYDRAIEFGIKGSNTYQRIGDLGSYAELEIEISRYYTNLGNTQMAIKNLNSLNNFAIRNGGRYYEAKCAIELSKVYQIIGNDEEANIQLEKGKAIAKDIGATDLI